MPEVKFRFTEEEICELCRAKAEEYLGALIYKETPVRVEIDGKKLKCFEVIVDWED